MPVNYSGGNQNRKVRNLRCQRKTKPNYPSVAKLCTSERILASSGGGQSTNKKRIDVGYRSVCLDCWGNMARIHRVSYLSYPMVIRVLAVYVLLSTC